MVCVADKNEPCTAIPATMSPEAGSMEKLMMDLSRDVESGTTLSGALSKHPIYFNRLFTSLTEAGEESGKLDTMLDRFFVLNCCSRSMSAGCC